jgi:hypothetical protein
MLEARVKQLKKQAREDFRYNETLLAKACPFVEEGGSREGGG